MSETPSRFDGEVGWSTPEPGMYVATIGSVTIGYVIDVPRGFVAFDADARPIVRCQTLRAAKMTVQAQVRTSGVRPPEDDRLPAPAPADR